MKVYFSERHGLAINIDAISHIMKRSEEATLGDMIENKEASLQGKVYTIQVGLLHNTKNISIKFSSKLDRDTEYRTIVELMKGGKK